MPRIQLERKTRQNSTPHDSYTITIPYRIARELASDTLYCKSTPQRMLFYRRPASSRIPVHLRTKRTKTYGGERYYSARITIPISVVKGQGLKAGDQLDVTSNANFISMKKR